MHYPTIALISGKHPITGKSGYARYAGSLARVLTSLGHSVDIFCVSKNTSVTKTPIGTIHEVKIPLLRLVSGREMTALVPASILIAKAINADPRLRGDDIIIWGIGPWTLAGIIARNTPVYADYFTTLQHEYGIPFFSPLERYILSKSTKIITHYRSTERILHKEFGLTKFFRLPYAVDTQKIVRNPHPSKILLTICRNDARKGIRYLIQAYAILRKRGVAFHPKIVGPGQPMGPVDDLSPLFHRAYAFVLPSLEEGSGSIAILEAMAAGLPVVATNVDGIPEDIENGVSGLLVPPGNAAALADAIETVLTNPVLAQNLGRTASMQFRRKHGAGRVRTSIKHFLTASGILR